MTFFVVLLGIIQFAHVDEIKLQVRTLIVPAKPVECVTIGINKRPKLGNARATKNITVSRLPIYINSRAPLPYPGDFFSRERARGGHSPGQRLMRKARRLSSYFGWRQSRELKSHWERIRKNLYAGSVLNIISRCCPNVCNSIAAPCPISCMEAGHELWCDSKVGSQFAHSGVPSNLDRILSSSSSFECNKNRSYQAQERQGAYDYLRSCKCRKFFRRLGHAPLGAQIGLVAPLGAIAVWFVWLGITCTWGPRQQRIPKLLLTVAGVGVYGIGVWAGFQLSNCHPMAHCEGSGNPHYDQSSRKL